jgi:hypothetical protein
MLTLNLNLQDVQASVASRTAETIFGVEVSDAEFYLLGQGSASNSVTGFLVSAVSIGTTEAQEVVALADDVWTPQSERRFAALAEREALGRLTLEQKAELERLTVARRASKNPRPGEEVIGEYEQRKLTRDLVEALTKYVSFHEATRRSSPTQKKIH